MADPPITERHKPHFHRKAPVLEACRAATTASVTISTALNNGDTLDGITLATGDRVLVKNQSTGSQNGIYVVGATPIRAYDLSVDDPNFGFSVFVREGTTNGGTHWDNTNTAAPTIDTTALTFASATGAGTSFGTPALTLSTTNAAGAASTAIRTDATIALFDATAPVTQAIGDAAATGSAAVAPRRDHTHGMPAFGGDGSAATISRSDHSHGGGGGGGGGFTHTYLGYNTVGGSWETIGALKIYAKKVTVSTAGILVGISAYVQATTSDQVGGGVAVAVYDDVSGTPDNVIMHTNTGNDVLLMDDTAGAGGVSHPRWLHRPVGMYVAAADYWIACIFPDQQDGIQLAYDGSGSDRTYTAGGNWFADWGFYTPTTTSNRYSIRASIIT